MRKPGAAHLVNWFYELPPFRKFLHALEALEQLAEALPDQRVARLFAARQLGNPRAATSARARRFLKTQMA